MSLWRILSVSGLLALSISFYAGFVAAYLHPSKSVLAHINRYGEANIEFVALTLIIVFGTIALTSMIKEAKH